MAGALSQWRRCEAAKRNMTPGHFPHCKELCKVRLAGLQGALTLESLAQIAHLSESRKHPKTR